MFSKISSFIIICIFFWQNAVFCIPQKDFTLRPPLRSDELRREDERIKDSAVKTATILIKHAVENILNTIIGFLVYAREEEISGRWGEWLDDKKSRYLNEGIEIFFEGIEELIKDTEKCLYEIKIEKKEEIVKYIADAMNSFLHFKKSLYKLVSSDINDVMRIHYERIINKEGFGDKLKFVLCEEQASFDKKTDKDGLIIICIIDNLIDNARRAGDFTSHVIVKSAKEDDEWIRIEVLDEGRGVPIVDKDGKRVLERIFEENFTTRESGEGGFGLSATYNFLKLRGGKIQVDTMSEDDVPRRLIFEDKELTKMQILEGDEISNDDRKRKERGATFTIWFPAEKGVDVVVPNEGLREEI